VIFLQDARLIACAVPAPIGPSLAHRWPVAGRRWPSLARRINPFECGCISA